MNLATRFTKSQAAALGARAKDDLIKMGDDFIDGLRWQGCFLLGFGEGDSKCWERKHLACRSCVRSFAPSGAHCRQDACAPSVTVKADLITTFSEPGAVPAAILKLEHRIPLEAPGLDRSPVIGDRWRNSAWSGGARFTHGSVHHCSLGQDVV